MENLFADTINKINTGPLHDATRKFNTIKPEIINDFFELDIFFSRIITTHHVSFPSSTSAHKHSFYELIVPISGSATYIFKKSKINLLPNKICLIVPKATHQLAKFSEDYAALTFGFYFLAPTTLTLPVRTNKEYFELKNSPYIISSLMHMLDLSQGSENGYYQRINMQFSLLMFEIINQIEPIRKAIPHIESDIEKNEISSDNARIRSAIQYITDNISSDILVDDVAASAGICSRQLNRILISSMNISANELINKIKIKMAKKYIESSSLTITQISSKCGFNSLTSFNRTFKKFTGVSPKVYRQNQETSNQSKDEN